MLRLHNKRKTIAIIDIMYNELDLVIDRPIVTSPKEFVLKETDAYTASKLNSNWHSVLPDIPPANILLNRHYVCYVAQKDLVNFAVAIWTTPIAANRFKNGNMMLELRRLAICHEAPRNTATWMISRMVKDISNRFSDIYKLISYQDTNKHLGTIYKASNWTPAHTTKFLSWKNHSRTGNNHNEQSTADKIRWEYIIKDLSGVLCNTNTKNNNIESQVIMEL